MIRDTSHSNHPLEEYPFFHGKNEPCLCGRVKTLDSEGGQIDRNGKEIRFCWKTPIAKTLWQGIQKGDLIQVWGEKKENIFYATGVKRLAPKKCEKPALINHIQKNRSTIELRHELNRQIRQFFYEKNFLEVETPSLSTVPNNEPFIHSFKTQFIPEGEKGKAQDLYLISSPEFDMKKLLTAGFEKIFQISRVWRNGEDQGQHNPEFSLLEWYRNYADAIDIMQDIENLLPFLIETLSPSTKEPFFWQPPYEKIAIKDIFMEYAKIPLKETTSLGELWDYAKAMDMHLPNREGLCWNDLFTRIFVERVEPNLPPDRPFFLVDYPIAQASFAKIKKQEKCADRFEIYLGKVELGNGFSELNDPEEQKRRFRENLKNHEDSFSQPIDPLIDQDVIQTLEYGLPPSAGVAIGVDRLLMVLAGKENLSDILAFPFKRK